MHVVLSSHLLEEVERVSASVVILEAGRVVADGGVAELGRADPELVVDLDWGDGLGTDPADRLVETLRLAGVAATAAAPSRAVVALEGPSVYDIVRDALAEGGYSVRRLQRRTASLEDIYLASSADGRGS
jgi:ABC-type multidrug transport system ATPase subunit